MQKYDPALWARHQWYFFKLDGYKLIKGAEQFKPAYACFNGNFSEACST